MKFEVGDVDRPEKKERQKILFSSVIMSEEKKLQIESAISQLGHSEQIFEKWGFSEVFEKGTAVSLLFEGLPGTGKTLMAEAIADHLGFPLITIGAAEIESSTPGEAERNIKRYFAMGAGKRGRPTGEADGSGNPKLHKKEKCVLLFDECDSLITNRSNVGMIIRSQINCLLTELERHDGVVIFTTNRVEDLDPAMERRITQKIEFDFPDEHLRLKIWQRLIPKKCPLDKKIELSEFAKFEIAGGNIKNVVLNAARRAAFAKRDHISYEDFYDAIESEMKGMTRFQKLVKKGAARNRGGQVETERVSRDSSALSINRL